MIPHYPLVEQWGLDATAAIESWLLKLEWVQRDYNVLEDYDAASVGFEYTEWSSF